MEGDPHHKTEENKNIAPADGDLTPPEDFTEIDPSEFFDPEEFGIKRPSSRNADA